MNFNVKKFIKGFKDLTPKLGGGEWVRELLLFSSFSGIKVILSITKLFFSEFVKFKAF